jgi:hypothetical protein
MMIQGLIVVLSALAVWLVNQPRQDLARWGPVVGLASQPAWLYATWQAEQWGMFALSLFYGYAWGVGIHNQWGRSWLRKS